MSRCFFSWSVVAFAFSCSVALLKFHTVEYGDAAMLSMYQSFADGHVKVFHPKLDEDELPNVLEQRKLDIGQYRLPAT